ncbi:MAG TPA: type II toxin-antitoxin system RatA family toxin [Caulobacteraceae bacterium]|nr:type II toxin-antitoxin system RatA family toxin [Caulobacteraceae bacterium]
MRHTLTRRMHYTPRQLFDLVGDVERYPAFVPWVTDMRTWGRRESEPGVMVFDAEAKVRFAIIREHFSTHVRLDEPNLTIDANLISGPFRRLENHWRFIPIEGGTELSFGIDFEFGSRFLEGLLTANFERAVARLVGCFERRAQALYGGAK